MAVTKVLREVNENSAIASAIDFLAPELEFGEYAGAGQVIVVSGVGGLSTMDRAPLRRVIERGGGTGADSRMPVWDILS